MAITVGSRVRSLREAAGVGSRELDRLAGLKEGHVAVIELRSGAVEALTALRLADVFGVSLAFLVEGRGDVPDGAAILAAIERARAKVNGAGAGSSEAHPS